MIRNSLILLVLAGIGYIFLQFLAEYQSAEQLGSIASHYAARGTHETGSNNLVTAIIVTYRGLDTLGEVSILFLTAAIIGLIMKGKHEEEIVRPSGEILQTASKVLLPIIILVGTYIFINGHLSPGGGFQGGAVLASGALLLMLGISRRGVRVRTLEIIESISGFAFVVAGLLGIILAGGFLDNRFLGLGTAGELFSAGAIPLIYSFIGLKVGAELANIITKLNHAKV